MGQTWVVVAIILAGLALALYFWNRGEAASARKSVAPPKADKPAPSPDSNAVTGKSKVRIAADGHSSSAPPSEPRPASSQRQPPRAYEDDQDDDDDDITIVTLTPRLDLLAAAEGRLPDASEADEPDEDDLPDAVRASAVPIIYDEEAAEDEPTRAHAVILVSAVSQTDRGQKRKINEDRYLVLDDHQLYVVADGMGGHAGGEIASQCAVDTIAEAFKTQRFDGKPYEDVPRRGSELALAIQMANRAIYEKSRKEPKLNGMGTTIVSARFTPGKQRVYIGHVGDSRCYRFRAGQLTQITTDHTMAAAGMTGPFAEHLSRAVGIAAAVKVDLVIAKPRHDDVFLLCSDGLSKMVKDDVIAEVLAANPDPDEAAKVLVERANQSGGRDNITVVLVVVKDPKGFARYMQVHERKRKAAAASVSGESASASSPVSEDAAVSAEPTATTPKVTVVMENAPESEAGSTLGPDETTPKATEANPLDVEAVETAASPVEVKAAAPAPEASTAAAEAKAVTPDRASVPPPRPSTPPPRLSVPPSRPSAPPPARPSIPEGRVSAVPARPTTPTGSRPSGPEAARPSVIDTRATDPMPPPNHPKPPPRKKK